MANRTPEEIEREIQTLGEKAQEIKEKKLTLNRELDDVIAHESVTRNIERMNPDERRVMADLLRTADAAERQK